MLSLHLFLFGCLVVEKSGINGIEWHFQKVQTEFVIAA